MFAQVPESADRVEGSGGDTNISNHSLEIALNLYIAYLS